MYLAQIRLPGVWNLKLISNPLRVPTEGVLDALKYVCSTVQSTTACIHGYVAATAATIA